MAWYEQTKSLVDRFKERVNSQNWHLVQMHSNLCIYEMPGPYNYHIAKAQTRFSCPAETAFSVLSDPKVDRWRGPLEELKVLDTQESSKLVHAKFACKWPVEKRDVVFVELEWKEEGVAYIVDRSVQGVLEEFPDYIRASLNLAGFQVVPLGSECQVTYLVDYDPNSSMPDQMKSKLQKSFVKQLAVINSLCK